MFRQQNFHRGNPMMGRQGIRPDISIENMNVQINNRFATLDEFANTQTHLLSDFNAPNLLDTSMYDHDHTLGLEYVGDDIDTIYPDNITETQMGNGIPTLAGLIEEADDYIKDNREKFLSIKDLHDTVNDRYVCIDENDSRTYMELCSTINLPVISGIIISEDTVSVVINGVSLDRDNTHSQYLEIVAHGLLLSKQTNKNLEVFEERIIDNVADHLNLEVNGSLIGTCDNISFANMKIK